MNYTPPAVTVPEQVMPHAVNVGGSGKRYVAPGAVDPATVGGHIVAPPDKATATAQPVAHPSDVANAAANKKPVDLSQGDVGGTELPVVLAILAILALSVVTAGYARMVLLKRH